MAVSKRMRALYNDTSRPLMWLLGIGLLVVIGYGVAQVASVSTTAVGLLASLASLISGVLVGFLFGIPRRIEGTAAGERGYSVNTNLEQVSDWLTKAIVGVGLVELGSLATGFGALSRTLGAALGGGAVGVAAAIVIFFVPVGFLGGYLWARTFFTAVLAEVDIVTAEVAKSLADIGYHAQFRAGRIAVAQEEGVSAETELENREPLLDVPAPVMDRVSDLPALWREIRTVLLWMAGSVNDDVQDVDGVIDVLRRRGVLGEATVDALLQLSKAAKELSAGAVLSEADSAAVRSLGADTLAALTQLRRVAPAAFEQHVLDRLRAVSTPGWELEFDARLEGRDGLPFPVDAVVRHQDRTIAVEVKAPVTGARALWTRLRGWMTRVPPALPLLLVLPDDAVNVRAFVSAQGLENLRILIWDTEADDLPKVLRGMLGETPS